MHAPWWSSAAWLLYFSIVLGILFYLNTFYLRARTNHLLLLQEQRELEREKQAKEMNMRFFANIAHEFRNPLTIIAGPLMTLNAYPDSCMYECEQNVEADRPDARLQPVGDR